MIGAWLLASAATLAVAGIIIGLALAGSGNLSVYRVGSASMEPALNCAAAPGCAGVSADSILVSRVPLWFRPVRRGDVVVIRIDTARHDGKQTLVKRVVGLPGEHVAEIRGKVLVDDQPLTEPYLSDSQRDSGSFGPLAVPPQSYFVLGDNRSRSRDSRSFGAVRSDGIVGLVIARCGPLHRLKLLADLL
jgi:signal peptidase I